MSRTRGAAPPIGQYVLKLHGRCDLACDHCYVYQSVDQSWRTKPRSMSLPVLRKAAHRVAEHAAARSLPRVRVILHGGEPLLVGVERMREALACLRSTIEPVARLDLVMQTNGVRLDAAMCDVLKEQGVKVGVSLDGDREDNDRHRRFAHGAGSFDQVRAALALLRTPAYRELYAGLLCTIDIANDPIRVYEALLAERPPRVDFLLPHATWEHPPPRPGDDPTPYATWLSAVHRRWLADGRPMRVRMFEALESTARGGPSGSEQLGADAVDLVVIETDGRYEQVDTIKTAYEGAPATGLSVFTHPVDEVALLEAVAGRQSAVTGLSPICRSCPVLSQCGGGLYAHRYRPGAGFGNPSVYCADLRVLIDRTNEESRMHAENAKPDDMSTVPAAVIDQIATGFGDDEAIGWLADRELSITRALLFAVADQHGPSAAWETLAAVEATSPDAVREVLSHPYVRPWVVERLRGSEVSFLGSLAAAAAVRAGQPADLEVEIADGVVHLPAVGTAYLPAGSSGSARVRADGGVLRLTGPGGVVIVADPADPAATVATGSWQPARRIALEDGWTVRLEDGDPVRACHRWSPAERLRDADESQWRSALAEAWRLIRAEAPGYVPSPPCSPWCSPCWWRHRPGPRPRNASPPRSP
ncbi:FxsB family cyclophane-forming radical SAM/SPASM peptide maturase, partial [Actinoplanes sp. NPDC049596]|uniref:FxsB family cyclophane-forming radical SAM/SPASM peptide maturase n=1 Tax=Actinoplanes sp. NPDC049596 TaxID=3154625 RepID=UPI00343C8FCE